MAFDSKKYLDSAGLTHLWSKIEAELKNRDTNISNEVTRATGVEGQLVNLTTDIKTNLVAAINEVDEHADAALVAAEQETKDRIAQIGPLGKVSAEEGAANHTVKSYVEAKVTEINNSAAALEGRVSANEEAIEVINGEGEGSIKKAASDAIAAVVASAPQDFDTLKEVADWIANDTTGAAKMQADIAILKSSDTVEGSVAKVVKDAVTNLDAEVNQSAGADGLALKVVEVDGKLTSIVGSIAANTYDVYGSAAKVLGTNADVDGTATVYGAMAKAQAVYNSIIALTTAEIDEAITAGKPV